MLSAIEQIFAVACGQAAVGIFKLLRAVTQYPLFEGIAGACGIENFQYTGIKHKATGERVVDFGKLIGKLLVDIIPPFIIDCVGNRCPLSGQANFTCAVCFGFGGIDVVEVLPLACFIVIVSILVTQCKIGTNKLVGISFVGIVPRVGVGIVKLYQPTQESISRLGGVCNG